MKVSVCIPTYNQASYVESAVRSVFQQTYMPFEIIVSDDCSTDGTSEILKKLSDEIQILKVIDQPKNLGIAGNVDCCLRYATGDFVVRLDSDDQLSPFYIERLIESISKYPEAGYAHAAVQEIDQFGNFLNRRHLLRGTGYFSPEDALKSAINGYRVAANIVMFKIEALKAVDYLKGLPNFGEDYYMTSAISAVGYGNIYRDDILSYYRIWLDTQNVRQKRKLAEIVGIYRVFNEILEPAFKKRHWSLNGLKKSRTRFACQQADCLSWDIYSKNEKEEIIMELYKLSNARMVKFYIWMYINGFATSINFLSKIKILFKNIVKGYLKKIRNFNVNTAN